VIRALGGLALAAALVPLILGIVSIAKYLLDVPDYQFDLATAGWIFSFTLPAAMALGFPAHLAARRRDQNSFSYRRWRYGRSESSRHPNVLEHALW
jgi:hypothetical protein